MFFTFMRGVVRVVLFIVNGPFEIQNKEALPTNENYILVAPHRTWWDPLYMAVAARPKKFAFMAKEELFKNAFLRFILKNANAFSVNRAKPGPSAIKTPIKILKETDLSLIMFPSGTRHSTALKGGMAMIAKMAKVRVVPVVYQGPVTLKDLFKRKKVVIRFGEPIDVSDIKKLNAEGLQLVEERVQGAFDNLDKAIDPTFKYQIK
ncbi:lysophospholipid acyltransferase family protein [Enterococcus eurekensis]|uniref:Lysophospholipid acyltransferase family protein n=2 Tax=Enterococcus TaxID=1350 RepID=A0ABV9M469_9ENTE|nr:1-acyl-sn-glycerol-3-phosphate acyltransferase [Candidatus Enterococcus avicola]